MKRSSRCTAQARRLKPSTLCLIALGLAALCDLDAPAMAQYDQQLGYGNPGNPNYNANTRTDWQNPAPYPAYYPQAPYTSPYAQTPYPVAQTPYPNTPYQQNAYQMTYGYQPAPLTKNNANPIQKPETDRGVGALSPDQIVFQSSYYREARENGMAYPLTAAKRFPYLRRNEVDELFVEIGASGRLSARQLNDVDHFLDETLGEQGRVSLRVDAPAHQKKLAEQIAQVALRKGLRRENISTQPIESGNTMRLTVFLASLSTPPCRTGGYDMNARLDNLQMFNLGCSFRRNLANLIANPQEVKALPVGR